MNDSGKLDAAMAAAFGLHAEIPAPSVLARLSAGGAALSQVHLSERSSTADQPLLSSAGDGGRYRILGEIARGGVGVILKGHDVDLGRDVAMKVLREEHLCRSDVLQRFVEEAQIGGQLQHPGIVPVYELGLGREQSPFFTMKLVEGKTLAALLRERSAPADDRRQFVGIFERVCQTMAYAHTRGVVHRDLKPANVMVGAFGEVLVVDWGMGKVLARRDASHQSSRTSDAGIVETVRTRSDSAHSAVGSLMGTPAYMAPEQARGEIDRLDE